jgi:hypothetical protein
MVERLEIPAVLRRGARQHATTLCAFVSRSASPAWRLGAPRSAASRAADPSHTPSRTQETKWLSSSVARWSRSIRTLPTPLGISSFPGTSPPASTIRAPHQVVPAPDLERVAQLSRAAVESPVTAIMRIVLQSLGSVEMRMPGSRRACRERKSRGSVYAGLSVARTTDMTSA